MANAIELIPLDKLVGHQDNPNRMSGTNFTKLVRNIKRTGRYEPLIVRPCPDKSDYFQIINGHHRCKALAQLGYKQADCIVWEIDDEQTDILLATLNRLGGSDELAKKLVLLKRLNRKIESGELAKFLPQTAKQIERLINLRKPGIATMMPAKSFANPMVFFLTDTEQQIVEKALSLAGRSRTGQTKASRNASGLVCIAEHFINNSATGMRGPEK
jgi:ParB-like chromosome segregation protein Spo0J